MSGHHAVPAFGHDLERDRASTENSAVPGPVLELRIVQVVDQLVVVNGAFTVRVRFDDQLFRLSGHAGA